MKELKVLNKYFLRYKWHLLLGTVFVIVSNIFGVLPPVIIRYALDLVKENIAFYRLYAGMGLQEEFYSIFTYGLLFFGILVLLMAVLKGLFMFLMRQTLIIMSRHIEFDLRNEIYAHYQKLDQAFYKRNSTGDLMSRISEDVSRVRMYLGPAIMYALNTLVLFVMVIGVMLSVNAELTLYVLLPLPILSITIYYINNIINKRSEAIQRQLSFLTTVTQEVYSGIRVIKAYVQERNYVRFFAGESEKYKEKSLELARVQALFFPFMLLLIGLSTIITIYVGGVQVISGKISTGNIAEFVIYVGMLTWPVTSLGWVASIIQRAAASQKRINEFLETGTLIYDRPNTMDVEIRGAVEFRNVSFRYPDTGVEALKNVSFKLEAGERLAIVGRTGSGKSTIADLLTRTYEPTSGQILIDGMDIRDISLKSLRRQIAYVPQDTFLFSDSIRNNIAFGLTDEEAGQERIESAARLASIHDEIKALPAAYETLVGERGVTLSGGQKQRISIARAFIRDPRIVILDDSLSAVDANTEKVIMQSLKEELRQRTAIVITHRAFSFIRFDHIIVLDQGAIVEEGLHEELIRNKGLYYELMEKQKTQENLS